MISRRIHRKPENDNYRRLANYIADASRDGEKCLMAWSAGCWAGDDYALAIQEVTDTQDLNTRTTKEKTYHLIVSFRPEDEDTLTPEVLKEIEAELAKALGFEEHQRHCGVHKNTANLHMHVAFNMIHPEKLTRHDPFRDYHTRDRVCRELEKRFGLAIDHGRNQGPTQPLGDGAATVEAHTGQQSFESYAKHFRESILASLKEAADWQGLHHALALHGLEIKPHGNGLVIKDRHGKHMIKASSLARSLAKGNLEKRLGRFQPAGVAVDTIESNDRYQAKPLQRQSPERDKLLAEYRACMAGRRKARSALREERTLRLETIERTWKRQLQEVGKLALTKRDRYDLFKEARQHEAKLRRQLGREMAGRHEKIREAFPYTSWCTFLRWEAEHGNEAALAVLRSREKAVEPEHGEVPRWCSSRRSFARGTWEERKRAILGESQLQQEEKRTLLSVAHMRYLSGLEADADNALASKPLQGFTYAIDSKGTVIFTLASGGLIRDMGGQIVCSAHDPAAREVGLRLARLKWGKEAVLDGNRALPVKRDIALDRQSGLER
jgi:hypothetical protein